MTDIATAGIGHNLPTDPAEALRLKLEQDNEDITNRRDELFASVERLPKEVTNKEARGNFAELVRLLKKCKGIAEKRHKDAKAPHLEAGRTVDDFFKRGCVEPLAAAAKKAESIMSVYDRKVLDEERRIRDEAARVAREEAERAAAEAETDDELDDAIIAEEQAQEAIADANASVADMTRGHGDMGAVSSMSAPWKHRNIDARTIDLEALRPYLNMEALDKACRAFIRDGGRELRGAEIFQEYKTTVR